MLGTFTYHNPTKLHFGSDSLSFLPEELAQFGPNVVLAYGGGSIKRNGVYDQFIGILHDAGKSVTEIAGVMPNPAEKLKIGHVFASSGVMPRFSILNPEFTLSLPPQAGYGRRLRHLQPYLRAVLQRHRRQRQRLPFRRAHAQRDRKRPDRRRKRSGLRSPQQRHVGGHLGAEHACLARQVHRLDGSHARPGSRRSHKRNPWLDACGGEPALLPLHHGCRVAQVRPLRHERVGRRPRWQERWADSRRRAYRLGSMDEEAGASP